MGGEFLNNANSEQQNSDIGNNWDTLGDVPFASAATESAEATEVAPAQPELAADQHELELRTAAETALGKFAEIERGINGDLSHELADSGYDALSEQVGRLGNSLASVDESRNSTLLAYIDGLFRAPDAASEAGRMSQADLRKEYLADSGARAALVYDFADEARRMAAVGGSEKVYYDMQYLKNHIPDDQLGLARAYLDYFDAPTSRKRRSLDAMVGNYTEDFRRVLRHTTEDFLGPADNSPLAQTMGAKVGEFMTRGYQDIHAALLGFFDYKFAQAHPEAAAEQAAADQAFERGRQNVLDLIV